MQIEQLRGFLMGIVYKCRNYIKNIHLNNLVNPVLKLYEKSLQFIKVATLTMSAIV